MLNICLKITKPEPVYAYKHHAYKRNMYLFLLVKQLNNLNNERVLK